MHNETSTIAETPQEKLDRLSQIFDLYDATFRILLIHFENIKQKVDASIDDCHRICNDLKKLKSDFTIEDKTNNGGVQKGGTG